MRPLETVWTWSRLMAHSFGMPSASVSLTSDGSDRGFTKHFEGRVSREDEHRAPLVGIRETIPADFALPHQSGQTCSVSHPSNSLRRTGFLA